MAVEIKRETAKHEQVSRLADLCPCVLVTQQSDAAQLRFDARQQLLRMLKGLVR